MLIRAATLLGLVLRGATAFVVAGGTANARNCCATYRRAAPPALQEQKFDPSAQQFDLLSLRSYRRDTILQYDATNQSEPLRIALTLFGILFSLCVPTLFGETQDAATTTATAAAGTAISGLLFLRNRAARSARMAKIDREYAMGALRVVYRGLRTNPLTDLRDKRRVVAIVGTREFVDAAVAEARVYRRRLAAANAVIVPVYTTDDSADGAASGAGTPVGEAESRWLYAAAEPEAWRGYFNELLSSRGMALEAGGAWLGLNYKGRSFGSAKGAPRWDELLGTALQPSGDGFGEFKELATDTSAAAAEAAATAVAMGLVYAGSTSTAIAEARGLLDVQEAFYQALTRKDVVTMERLWKGAPADASVSEAIAQGARIEPWAMNSPSFPPEGMRATDRDALIMSADEAWTTAIERPSEGGTLLATQRWRRGADGEWLLCTHRYIPWSADGATAVVTLRCDGRGCVLLGREINTRDRRGAVL